MELQFYPPGFTPFVDSQSCDPTHWCAAVTIDSLEAEFNFVDLNPACTEPVNLPTCSATASLPGRPARS